MFLRQHYGICRVLENISGACQTQSMARIRKCIGYFATAMTIATVLTVRTMTLVFPRLAASAASGRSLVSASSCAQGDRSAASVLPLIKTTVSCSVGYDFSMVSSNCGKLLGRVKEKFLSVLPNP